MAWSPLAVVLGPPAVARPACSAVAECHGVCWSPGLCNQVSVGDVVVVPFVASRLGPAHKCLGWAAGVVCGVALGMGVGQCGPPSLPPREKVLI